MGRSRCAARRAAPSVGAWGDGYRNLLRLREHLRTLPRFAGASPRKGHEQQATPTSLPRHAQARRRRPLEVGHHWQGARRRDGRAVRYLHERTPERLQKQADTEHPPRGRQDFRRQVPHPGSPPDPLNTARACRVPQRRPDPPGSPSPGCIGEWSR